MSFNYADADYMSFNDVDICHSMMQIYMLFNDADICHSMMQIYMLFKKKCKCNHYVIFNNM